MNSKSPKGISKILLKLDLKNQVIEYNDDHWDDVIESIRKTMVIEKKSLGASRVLLARPK